MSINNPQQAQSLSQLQIHSDQKPNKYFYSCFKEQSNTRIRFHKINDEKQESGQNFQGQFSKTINQKEIQARQKIFKNKMKNVDKKMMLISYDLFNSQTIQKASPMMNQDISTINKTYKTAKNNKKSTFQTSQNKMDEIYEEQSESQEIMDEGLQFEVMKMRIQNINKKVRQQHIQRRIRKNQKKQFIGPRQKPIKKKKINQTFQVVLEQDPISPQYRFKGWFKQTYPRLKKMLTRYHIQRQNQKYTKNDTSKNVNVKLQPCQPNTNFYKLPNLPIYDIALSNFHFRRNSKYQSKLQHQQQQSPKNQHLPQHSGPIFQTGQVKLQENLYFEDQSYEDISVPICCKNNRHDHDDDIMKIFDQSD